MDQEPHNANDSVDDLVSGWGQALGGIDSSPLHVLSRISRIALRLDAARRQSFAAFNLQTWEFDVLSALRRATPPHELTPGELIDETLVTSGTMTNRITRMADRGLVTRHASERDRRVVNIRLTATGQTAVESAFMSLLSQEQNLLEGLSGQDKDVLTEILRRLLRTVEDR